MTCYAEKTKGAMSTQGVAAEYDYATKRYSINNVEYTSTAVTLKEFLQEVEAVMHEVAVKTHKCCECQNSQCKCSHGML